MFRALQVEHADRQRVYLAAQLVSATSAAAIRELYDGEEPAADACDVLDGGFDVQNSRTMFADKPLRCALGIHWEEQHAALLKTKDLMETARFGGRKSLLPCQKGWILSIRSTLALFEEMRRVEGFTFLLTARLNQDILESYFSTIRSRFGANVNPTPVELLQRARLLMVGVSPAAARNTPVQPACAAASTFLSAAFKLPDAVAAEPPSVDGDDSDCLSVAVVARICESASEAGQRPEPEAEAEEDPPIPAAVLEEAGLASGGEPTEVDLADIADRPVRFGMTHVAGYVAAKSAQVDPSLGTRTADVSAEAVPPDARWIQLISRGGLTVPSREWLGTFHQLEATFCALHLGKGMPRRSKEPDHLSRQPGVVSGLVAILRDRWPRLDLKVLTRYARLRTMIRMRYAARQRRADHAQVLRDAASKRKSASQPPTVSGAPSSRNIRKRRQFHRGAAHM